MRTREHTVMRRVRAAVAPALEEILALALHAIMAAYAAHDTYAARRAR